MKLLAAFLIAIFLPASAFASGSIIAARGAWAAIDRSDSCVALARSALRAPKGKVQATAGFTFTSDHGRWGEFHVHLSRAPRAGSSIMLTVGSQPFLLVARNDWAWSRGPAQEQAIIAAVRNSTGMRVEARDAAGTRFTDSYALDGAPTAIDAAAARCAGKMRQH